MKTSKSIIYYFSLCSLMLLSCGKAKMNENNDLAEENLRGSVSMVRTTQYYETDTKSEWKEITNSGYPEIKLYSPEGMLAREEARNYTDLYTYQNGKRATHKGINLRRDFTNREDTYQYEGDLLVKIEGIFWDNPHATLYEYDNQKRIVREVKASKERKEWEITDVIFHTYDNPNVPFDEEHIRNEWFAPSILKPNSPMPFEDKMLPVTDDCIVTNHFYKDGKLVNSTSFSYGREERTLISYKYSGKRLKEKVEWGNRKGPWLMTETYGKSGEILTRNTITLYKISKNAVENVLYWDLRYNCVEENYEYEYDKNGNWIVQTCNTTYYKDQEKGELKKKRNEEDGNVEFERKDQILSHSLALPDLELSDFSHEKEIREGTREQLRREITYYGDEPSVSE